MHEIGSVQSITKPINKNKKLVLVLILLIIASMVGAIIYYLLSFQFIFKIIDIHDQIKTEKVKYQETAIINNSVIISEKNNENSYLALNTLNWKMTQKRVLIVKDTLLYLKINKPITLNIENNQFLLENGFYGIYDSNLHQLIVIEGEIFHNNLVIKNNNYLDLSLNVIKPFDRNIFINDNRYKSLYEFVKNNNVLSSTIVDLEIPIIENLSISDGQEITNDQIEISGKTEPKSKFVINDEDIILSEDGSFKISKPLKNGENIFIFKITDSSNNIYHKKYTIIKKDSCIGITECGKCGNPACLSQETSNSSISSTNNQNNFINCDFAFANSLLSLINSYRQENGKNNLTLNSQLSTAACKHSNWMKNNNTLNHIGENGSQFYERCNMEGSNCDAENIAQGGSNAQTFFDMWKNSPGHNENMLGDHTQIGIGLFGDYATTVFY